MRFRPDYFSFLFLLSFRCDRGLCRQRSMRRGKRHLVRTIILTITGAAFGLSVTMCLQALHSPIFNTGEHSCLSSGDFSTVDQGFSMGQHPPDVLSRRDGDHSGQGPPRNLVFVGIMTAQKYVDSRAYEIYSTWAQNLVVNGSVAFFVSSTTESRLGGVQMPLIRFLNVDDSYPPQKKSFWMLKYFYENLLDQYEWFMRADDDVYVRLDKLEVFLRSLNSSETLFIGQAGLGTPEEYGQLNLGDDENYCMGGPGIILSRETLRRIGPRIEECFGSMMTTHEDVEVGRCVKRFAGVTCTWSYEMQTLFYNNQSGLIAFTGDLNVPEVHHSITLHPAKEQTIMRRLHGFIRGLKLSDLRFRSMQLSRDILMSIQELQAVDVEPSVDELNKVSDYALVPSLTKFVPPSHDELLAWEFLSPNIAFCVGAPNCPRHNIESYWRYATANAIRQVMDIVNKYARQRGRVLEFQEILYGYRRVDPFHGVDYVFDLLLLYKKFKGRRVTIPVRRHAYLQQSFGRLQLIEDDALGHLEDGADSTLRSEKRFVHIILPLSGRSSTFRRFVDLLEETCLKMGELVKLYIVLYSSTNSTDDRAIRESIQNLQNLYSGSHEIRLFELNGTFSRGSALSFGAAQCPPDALMFFTDVDVAFTGDFLRRLRLNTIRGRLVYFPVVFSQYAISKRRTPIVRLEDFAKFNYDSDSGYFRHFGYGLVGLYRSDFDAVGGFDLNIRGWGMEDVELFDKFVKKSNLTILRAPEPDLIHVYHPIACDPHLSTGQYEMCRGSRAASLASVQTLSQAFYDSAQFFSLFQNGASDSEQRKLSKTMTARMLKQFL